MKVTAVVGKNTIEVEGRDAKHCFEQMAAAQEIFGEYTCGACGSDEVVCVVREAGGHTFYEMRCKACGARLQFGQRKADGALYPRRKDASGNWLDNYGWTKWDGAKKQTPEPAGVPF